LLDSHYCLKTDETLEEKDSQRRLILNYIKTLYILIRCCVIIITYYYYYYYYYY